MSEQGVWASMASDDDVWPSMGAGAGADLGGAVCAARERTVQAAGPDDAGVDEDDIDDVEDLDEEDLDDDDDDDDDDEDDDLDEFEDDELDDDDEDDDDEADEIDFTEDRYGRIPGEDDADA